MRIFTEKALNDFIREYPESETALQDWIKTVRNSNWKNFSDIKKTFNSVDSVGNQRYVFNIKGNDYRLIVIIRFTIQYVYIRFVGTHAEYNKIDNKKIKFI